MGKGTARERLREEIKEIIHEEFAGIMEDVRYRLEAVAAQELRARVYARDLCMARHQLDGYTVTDNSPSAGSVAWADCNIVYKGTNYAITNGNTAMRYIYWQFSAADKTKFQVSDDKPELSEDDVLVFVNDGGIHHTVMDKMTTGAAILSGTVSGAEIGPAAIAKVNLSAGAVDADIIASGAVTTAKIASGAVSSTQLAATAVTADKLASGAVTTAKIASGAVAATNLADSAVTGAKIASGAVGATALADNAVTGAKIASGAVSATELASGAVTSGKIASGAVAATNLATGAVTSDKLASSSVTGGKIADGTIGGDKLETGAVAADKLRLALHMLM